MKRIYYKIGIALFGDFFKRLFAAQVKYQRIKKLQLAAQHKMRKQGISIYNIDGIEVTARNYKNALRKVRKLQDGKSSSK